MGKFFGIIGYSETIETSPGVWTEQIIEKKYTGDVIRNSSRWNSGQNLNDNLTIDNKFSILADPYAFKMFHAMRYISWMSILWKISSVEVQRPRLILTIGGIYNEQTSGT